MLNEGLLKEYSNANYKFGNSLRIHKVIQYEGNDDVVQDNQKVWYLVVESVMVFYIENIIITIELQLGF